MPDIEIIELAPSTVIAQSFARGPKGDPGATGAAGANGSEAASYPTNSPIGGHRLVIRDNAGFVQYASATIATHAGRVIGITTTAVSSGPVVVQSASTVTESSWNWTPNLPVYVGLNGVPTQTPVVGAVFSQIWGMALTATQVLIVIRDPIVLV